ncbi:hypothetical protein [Christiangramia aquimixticola]|uniref:hypothetical protein n=1 Tax=Christiangramia aquimixticola TaxID=1697558 RepID=UPI003AA973A4
MTEKNSRYSEFKNADQENEELEENEITALPPRLYSKRVIITFSALFSTIFGAVILMSNLKNLNERKGMFQVLVFGIIFTVGQMITVSSLQSNKFSLILNISGAIILNEYFWNRYIGKDKEYLKKNWVKPALISTLISLPFVFAILYLGGNS